MSNFDKYANHKKTNNSGASREVYVGVAPMKILAINPDTEQLRLIIGDSADKFNTQYALRANYNQQQVRPVSIWVQDVDENTSPTIINYDLGLDLVESKTGKGLFFSDDGKTSYANDESMMPSWTSGPYIQTRIGEAGFYDLIYKLYKWDQNEEVTFQQFLLDTGLDLDTIYSGNFKGLHSFVEYCTNNDCSVIAPFTVKVDHTDKGEVYRQRVLNRSEYIFSNYKGVTESQLKSLTAKEASQQTAGYQFTNDGYFIGELTIFDNKEHMKHVPNMADAIGDLLDL